ncbi:MAG: hypothetical protein GY822_05780 [Deltaproteobacteria bacterium]|nr:hypothetical protein [Deltaproteobacteria bacterium]
MKSFFSSPISFSSFIAIAAVGMLLGHLAFPKEANAGGGIRWQYRCVEFNKRPTKHANDLGKQGWEMVGNVTYQKGPIPRATTCFKRRK